MVKLVFQNSTDELLTISCKTTTEWPMQDSQLPSFDRMNIKPKSCRTVEDVKLTKVGSQAGELYWTLFIRLAPVTPEPASPDDDHSNSLFLRFRVHRELTGTSKSYTVMAVPEFNLLPRPKWGAPKKVWAGGTCIYCSFWFIFRHSFLGPARAASTR